MKIEKEQLKLAELIHKQNQALGRQLGVPPFTREDFVKLGAMFWPHMFKGNTDTYIAFDRVMAKGQAALDGEEESKWIAIASEILPPQNQIVYVGSALWCDQGFPVISMPHTYAAALLATNVPQNVLELARAPWRAFWIDVPESLLFAWDNRENREVQVTGVLVTRFENDSWNYAAFTETHITLWRHGADATTLVAEKVETTYQSEAFSEPLESMDDRTCALIGRLILNVCLSMADTSNVRATKEAQKSMEPFEARVLANPHVRRYLLGKPPSIDCREAVRNYVRHGAGRKLSLRHVVSGHWKPNLAARIGHPVWVEPYWRGPQGITLPTGEKP